TNYMVDVSDTATLTMIRASSPTALTVTLPDDTTAIQVGAYVVIGQSDDGQVTIAGAAGVTVNYVSTNTIAAKHGKATAIKVGPNEWDIYGDLA
ncbi:hypothetical protein IOK48_27335, partial [Escherichia coli]|uniref:hypothetical protein n=1 Tax=Escherichia coli TaxID=562 RepID=UPI0018E14E79